MTREELLKQWPTMNTFEKNTATAELTGLTEYTLANDFCNDIRAAFRVVWAMSNKGFVLELDFDGEKAHAYFWRRAFLCETNPVAESSEPPDAICLAACLALCDE